MQVGVEIAAFQIVLASTKGVVIVGVKIQKWNTTQLAPFFFFNSLLSVTFSVGTISLSSFRSCQDGKMCGYRHLPEFVKVLSGVCVRVFRVFISIKLEVACEKESKNPLTW